MCLQWLSSVFRCFASVSDICCKCFSYFGRMLQVFHLDVTKLDLVLHMLHWYPAAAAAGAQTVSRACAWEASGARAVSYAGGRHGPCMGVRNGAGAGNGV
jgi:hypothetical protein